MTSMKNKHTPQRSRDSSRDLNETENALILRDGMEVPSRFQSKFVDLLIRHRDVLNQLSCDECDLNEVKRDVDSLFRDLISFNKEIKMIADEVHNDLGIPSRVSKMKLNQLKSSFRTRSLDFLPGIKHDSTSFIEFKRRLVQHLNRLFPVSDIDSSGIMGYPGVPSNFDKLLTITGHLPDKVGIPSHNVSQTRRSLSLSNSISLNCSKFAKAYIDVLFECATEFTDIKVQGSSSSCGPDMVRGKLNKSVRMLHGMLHYKDIAADLRVNTPYPDLIEKYACTPTFITNYRLQSDTPGKIRSGVKSHEVLDDVRNSVNVKNNTGDNGTCTQRVRFVKGGDCVLNGILQIWFSAVMSGLYNVYPSTFKVSTAKDLESRLNHWESAREEACFGFYDVSSFDATSHPSLQAILKLKLREFCGDDFLTVYNALRCGEVVYRPVEKDGNMFVTDRVNSNFPLVLHSGIASVSFDGVFENGLNYCWLSFLILADIKKIDSEPYLKDFIRSFLQHKLDISTINKGDDHIVLFANAEVKEKFEQLIPTASLFKLETEHSTFVGYSIFRDPSTKEIRVTHNPVTFITNQLSPERGFFDYFNKLAAFGNMERRSVYSDSPIMHELQKEMNKVYGDVFKGDDLTSLFDYYAEIQLNKWKHLFGSNLSSKDLEVIADPSKLSWKFQLHEISDEVIKGVVSVIPSKHFSAFGFEFKTIKLNEHSLGTIK